MALSPCKYSTYSGPREISSKLSALTRERDEQHEICREIVEGYLKERCGCRNLRSGMTGFNLDNFLYVLKEAGIPRRKIKKGLEEIASNRYLPLTAIVRSLDAIKLKKLANYISSDENNKQS